MYISQNCTHRKNANEHGISFVFLIYILTFAEESSTMNDNIKKWFYFVINVMPL